jgi:very-short-patch-repair endonuclease
LGGEPGAEHADSAIPRDESAARPGTRVVAIARNRAIAELATRHHGVVTRRQLLDLGLGSDAIKHRIASGFLHPLHLGVYSLGHLALAPRANEAAALLACGPAAVLSHRSAAAAWALADPDPDLIDITLIAHKCRPKAGVRVRRVARLDALDVRSHDGLRVTAPARTLLDFAATATADELERAVAEARRRRLVTDSSLEGSLHRAPTRAGVRALRGLMGRHVDAPFTRSHAERVLLRLLRRAELPEPLTNVRLHGLEVDFYWPAAALVLEVDGHAFHGNRAAFERDRRRDQVLVAAGLRVIRVTWRQLAQGSLAVVARIAQALLVSAAGAA